ncbi:MAG: hypothetical protein KC800_16530 [Candidatus Eremiobacteraeota bacterium]|nr:hypothetical protein [Candidatus Eremiobacteraeota bacterium]
MKVSYTELNSKVSSDLTGISVAQSNKGKVMLVQDSTFEQVPNGAKAKLKSTSFSKLQPGDFIVVSAGDKMEVRRFLKLDLSKGATKLVVTDGAKQEQSVPFTRLVGQIVKVRRDAANIDPNPRNFIQRLAFKLSYRFS